MRFYTDVLPFLMEFNMWNFYFHVLSPLWGIFSQDFESCFHRNPWAEAPSIWPLRVLRGNPLSLCHSLSPDHLGMFHCELPHSGCTHAGNAGALMHCVWLRNKICKQHGKALGKKAWRSIKNTKTVVLLQVLWLPCPTETSGSSAREDGLYRGAGREFPSLKLWN